METVREAKSAGCGLSMWTDSGASGQAGVCTGSKGCRCLAIALVHGDGQRS